MPNPKPWDAEELKILHDTYPTGGAAACLKLLPHRSKAAITMKAFKENVQLCEECQQQMRSAMYRERVESGAASRAVRLGWTKRRESMGIRGSDSRTSATVPRKSPDRMSDMMRFALYGKR